MNPLGHLQFQASNNNNNPDKSRGDRHFVTWSEQEDNILREQVRINGTERWAIIASQLKDKTSRQCRRSDLKLLWTMSQMEHILEYSL